jgi:hypothetical protein
VHDGERQKISVDEVLARSENLEVFDYRIDHERSVAWFALGGTNWGTDRISRRGMTDEGLRAGGDAASKGLARVRSVSTRRVEPTAGSVLHAEG